MRSRVLTRLSVLLCVAFFGCNTPLDAARNVAPASIKVEPDILEFAERHPLGFSTSAGPAKYGDPELAKAVERLTDIPRPWTVPRILVLFEEIKQSWDTHDQDGKAFERYRQRSGDLARVLASSRDPRAALALGRAMETSNFPGSGPAHLCCLPAP